MLTTVNNVGSKALFNAVFIRPEQIVRFWLCRILGRIGLGFNVRVINWQGIL